MMPLLPKSQSNFLLLCPLLKLLKDRWEPGATAGVPLVLVQLLLLLPFYSRNKKRSLLFRPLAVLSGFALVAWFSVYTILGHNSEQGASLVANAAVSVQASASVKAGAELFSSQGCAGCHRVDGSGGHIGPNLSNIGSEGLSRQWLTVQISNPKKHGPESIMPSFASLSNENLNALLTYLESIKGSSRPTVSSQSAGSPVKSVVESQAALPARQSQYPGSGTYKFISLTIAGFSVAVLLVIGLWIGFTNGFGRSNPARPDQKQEGQTDSSGKDLRPDNQRLRTSSEEDKSAETYHKKQESDEPSTSSASFALIIIIIVAIITTAVILIFSSFVTTKPVPSVTTRHISSQQENQSGNTGRSVKDQSKENKE